MIDYLKGLAKPKKIAKPKIKHPEFSRTDVPYAVDNIMRTITSRVREKSQPGCSRKIFHPRQRILIYDLEPYQQLLTKTDFKTMVREVTAKLSKLGYKASLSDLGKCPKWKKVMADGSKKCLEVAW